MRKYLNTQSIKTSFIGGGTINFRFLIAILLLGSVFISSCITIVQSPKESTKVETKQEAEFQGECSLPAGIGCTEHKVEPNKVMLKIKNALGYDILLRAIRTGDEFGVCVAYPEYHFRNGDTYVATMEYGCNNGNVGDVLNKKIYVAYQVVDRPNSQDIIVEGVLRAKIMPSNTVDCYSKITSKKISCDILKRIQDSFKNKDECIESMVALQDGRLVIKTEQDREYVLDLMEYCFGERRILREGEIKCYSIIDNKEVSCKYRNINVNDCEDAQSNVVQNFQNIQGLDEDGKTYYRDVVNFCRSKGVLRKREFSHKINVIEPKISYDCTRLNAQTASDETVARCNLYNYCDKMEAYDITVRKSATDAISQHLNQAYSTSQLIDVYSWAKNNVAYQNVPLDDFAPYRPSETITLKSGDCKNYAAVISSMILSIGGSARIVVVPSCIHAFAEVYIGKDYSLIDNLAQEIKERYQQDIEINVIKDAQGYWLILDGAGANYAGTTEIKECLNPNAERYYSYSCISSDGKISKQTYKKEYLSQAVTFLCDNCKSLNDCQPECKYVCIKADWVGEKGAKGYEVSKYLGLKTEVYCTCTCYK